MTVLLNNKIHSKLGTFENLIKKPRAKSYKKTIPASDFRQLAQFVETGTIVPVIGTATFIDIKHTQPDMRQYLIIDLDNPFPNNNISIIIYGNFSDKLTTIREQFLNQKIIARGKIKDHKMRLHIIVDSMKNIKKESENIPKIKKVKDSSFDPKKLKAAFKILKEQINELIKENKQLKEERKNRE